MTEQTETQCHGFEDCPCDDVACKIHGAGSYVMTPLEVLLIPRWRGPYCKEFGEPWRRVWPGFLRGPEGELPA